MGNRVHLQLRGSALPYLAEEDEEDVAELESSNGLPLFWMALLRAEDLGGAWEAEVRAALADEDGGTPVEPVRLAWTAARRNLLAALDRAGERLPDLAPLLRDWTAGLEALARRGPAQEVRLDLAEFSNFHEDADAYLAELRRAVAVWHGDGPADLPDASDAGRDLTGFDSRTGLPFPRAMPEWQAGRPPPWLPPTIRDRAAEWGMVTLGAAFVLGMMWLGSRVGHPNLGLLLGTAVIAWGAWRWAGWMERRRDRRR